MLYTQAHASKVPYILTLSFIRFSSRDITITYEKGLERLAEAGITEFALNSPNIKEAWGFLEGSEELWILLLKVRVCLYAQPKDREAVWNKVMRASRGELNDFEFYLTTSNGEAANKEAGKFVSHLCTGPDRMEFGNTSELLHFKEEDLFLGRNGIKFLIGFKGTDEQVEFVYASYLARVVEKWCSLKLAELSVDVNDLGHYLKKLGGLYCSRILHGCSETDLTPLENLLMTFKGESVPKMMQAIEYRDPLGNRSLFVLYIKQCYQEFSLQSRDMPKYYAPYTVLCQSSGYGKTRMVLEMHTEFYLVYICLRKTGSSGQPRRSRCADGIDGLKTRVQFSNFLAALFQTMREFLRSIQGPNLQISFFAMMQDDDGERTIAFWSRVWSLYDNFVHVYPNIHYL